MTCEAPRLFRAPGKLVLVGEYAVLDGAPAVVVAVDRGVECAVTPAYGERTVACPGDPALVRAALDRVSAPGGHYVFRDWNPAPTGTKPGFGGSAAATVVAAHAGLALRGVPTAPATLFDAAQAVHHALHGGGSGVDVAASAWGGTLRFQVGETPLPLPPTRPAVVWSGRSASTGPRVQAYLAWRDRAPFARASADLALGFASDPIGALDAARDLLAAMARAVPIDWATPEHERIAALARDHGGAAKASGAGGGDCAVALFPDSDREAAFLAACAAEGFLPLPVQVARGAHEVVAE